MKSHLPKVHFKIITYYLVENCCILTEKAHICSVCQFRHEYLQTRNEISKKET